MLIKVYKYVDVCIASFFGRYYYTAIYPGGFLNQARGRRLYAWFLEIVLVHVSVCVCVCLSVCPPPRPLITSGVIWCGIDLVRLVKQVLQLFPAFNYFIRQLPSIKWMGVAILTQLVVNACQRKLR